MKFPEIKHIRENIYLRIRKNTSALNPGMGEGVVHLYNLTLLLEKSSGYMEAKLTLSGEPFDGSAHELYLDEEEVEEIIEFLEDMEELPEFVE